MSDYTRKLSTRDVENVVGVRDLKTHASHIVEQVREAGASYVVTHRGEAVGVILPVGASDPMLPGREDVDADAAWHAFLQAGRRLERRFQSGVSGVEILSTTRR